MAKHPCPVCGSSDGVEYYSNGWYCFACSYNHKSVSSSPVNTDKRAYNLDHNTINLSDVPPLIQQLLYQKYFLDNYDHIVYQDSLRLYNSKTNQTDVYGAYIGFPWYDNDGQCIAIEYKALTNTSGPKNISIGSKTIVYVYKETEGSTIITEDIISAIRVSKFGVGIPLRGTSINDIILNKIKDYGPNFIIWLDGDEPGRKAAQKLYRHLKNWVSLDGQIQIIHTDKDPKCYNDNDIKTFLGIKEPQ